MNTVHPVIRIETHQVGGPLYIVKRGFLCDVTSSQFASHYTFDRHVAFLFVRQGIGKQ